MDIGCSLYSVNNPLSKAIWCLHTKWGHTVLSPFVSLYVRLQTLTFAYNFWPLPMV